MNNILKTLKRFMRTANIYILTSVPTVLALGLIFSWALISGRVFHGNIAHQYHYLVIACASFIASLGGLAQIIRREAPGFTFKHPFHGTWPIVMGWLWFALCLFAGFGMIYYAFVE